MRFQEYLVEAFARRTYAGEAPQKLNQKETRQLGDEMDQAYPSVGHAFFPHHWDGGQTMSVSSKQFGQLEFKPLMNGKIRNELDMQGPGTTDMGVPFGARMGDGSVLVFVNDGLEGDAAYYWPPKTFQKKKVTKHIEDNHFTWQDYDDDDDDW